MKSDIELNHIWMEPTPLGKLWTILGLVPGGPKGLLGPIFDFWGSQGPKLAIFQRAIVAPPVEIFENFKGMTSIVYWGLLRYGKNVRLF